MRYYYLSNWIELIIGILIGIMIFILFQKMKRSKGNRRLVFFFLIVLLLPLFLILFFGFFISLWFPALPL
jgi:Ca2+/Na+ antiporter